MSLQNLVIVALCGAGSTNFESSRRGGGNKDVFLFLNVDLDEY